MTARGLLVGVAALALVACKQKAADEGGTGGGGKGSAVPVGTGDGVGPGSGPSLREAFEAMPPPVDAGGDAAPALPDAAVANDGASPTPAAAGAAASGRDTPAVRKQVNRYRSRLSNCYERRLVVKPDLAGTVTVSFVIAADGTVVSAEASGVDPEVAECVAKLFRSLRFPKVTGGGMVQVRYPITFGPDPG
ncbi:MAG TPA: AgmX/PglI C-terminal domain-containing protein [Kofleriaceae bacterium]|jgi:hypothetical protein|nr:AgmX/PglI C-terminal domain-containing protein [Kofleriaceae bacterium]